MLRRRKGKHQLTTSVWGLIKSMIRTFGMKLKAVVKVKAEGIESKGLITMRPKNNLRRKCLMSSMISSTSLTMLDTMQLEMTQKALIIKQT